VMVTAAVTMNHQETRHAPAPSVIAQLANIARCLYVPVHAISRMPDPSQTSVAIPKLLPHTIAKIMTTARVTPSSGMCRCAHSP
jgi:hypothetical protein